MITVIANLKGGTGKSTVTFNLAVWLSTEGRRATVIDLDPQRTLTDVAALRAEEGIAPAILVESGPFADVDLPEDAEEIIVDVGTADLGSFTQAIMIADRIVIPVTPSQADIWSTQRFLRFLYKNTHGNPPDSITFINRADTNQTVRASDEAAAALRALPGVRLLPERLSDRAVFRESFSEGQAVFELEPRSVATREFRALAEALFSRGYRAAVERLRKQKTPGVADAGFRDDEELPTGDMVAVDGAVPAVDAAEEEAAAPVDDDHVGWQKGTKEGRRTKEEKKRRKAAKDKQAGKGKKGKKDKHKKGKKDKKGGKTKKRKKAA